MKIHKAIWLFPLSCQSAKCATVGVVNSTVDAGATAVDTTLSSAGKVVAGVFDAVDPRSPNMLSLEMREEKFYDQSLAFQTNLLRLASCANAAYPGVDIPRGYRPFTDAEWRACGLDAF